MVALAVAVGLLLNTQAEEARDRARDAFAQGQELYRAGDYAAALAAFQSAQAAGPKPATEYNIGRCYERLGQLADAVVAYESYLTDAPDAPDHETVKAHVAELKGQAPPEAHLRVAVEPLNASVAVDQAASEPAPIDKLLPPGRHLVLAELNGYTPIRREVELLAGTSLQLDLTLQPVPVAAPTRAPDAAVHQNIPAPAPPPAPQRTWTYVALAVAVVAVGVGLGFGISSKSAQNNLQARVHTQVQAQQFYDTAHTDAVAANWFYAGAAVAGASAITLFFLEPKLGGSP